MLVTTLLRSSTTGARICFRLKASSCFVNVTARSPVCSISSRSRRMAWPAGNWLIKR